MKPAKNDDKELVIVEAQIELAAEEDANHSTENHLYGYPVVYWKNLQKALRQAEQRGAALSLEKKALTERKEFRKGDRVKLSQEFLRAECSGEDKRGTIVGTMNLPTNVRVLWDNQKTPTSYATEFIDLVSSSSEFEKLKRSRDRLAEKCEQLDIDRNYELSKTSTEWIKWSENGD